jgi:2-polyprenyl-3-methyl-5-hydroxy-6-metoxy-1,4-benzoquinol methylase
MAEGGHDRAGSRADSGRGSRERSSAQAEEERLAAVYSDDYLRILGVEHWHAGYFEPDIAPDDLPTALERYLEVFLDPLGIKPEHKVLEIGCNAGATTSWMVKRYGCTVHAIDILPKMVEATERRLRRDGITDRASVSQMDAEQLTFEDASFDYVIAAEVTFHLADKRRCLKEAARVLKPGGQLALVEFMRGEKTSALGAAFSKRYFDSEFLETEAQYRGHLAVAGFGSPRITDHHEQTIIPTNRAYMSERYRNRLRACIVIYWGVPFALAQPAILWYCDRVFRQREIRHVFLYATK